MTVCGPYEYPHYYIGLSTDTKPTAVLVGDEFFETDTKATYIYSGSAWVTKAVPDTYYWCEDFDDEVAAVQFESGLNADFWVTAGTNYAAANVTYMAGVGGTLKAKCAAADNDSVTALGALNCNTSQNPILEARIKIDTKETAGFYVGFSSAAFANINSITATDCFLVGINSDNGHTFGATRIISASNDNNGGVVYNDMGVAIVSDTFIKVRIDLRDIEQPRVWIDGVEVAPASITGTVKDATALAPYFMVQNLAAGAIQRFVTIDYIKVWQDRG